MPYNPTAVLGDRGNKVVQGGSSSSHQFARYYFLALNCRLTGWLDPGFDHAATIDHSI